MSRALEVLAGAPVSQGPAPSASLAERVAALEAERESLLELLAQQQRVAQAGLITSGLAHDVDNHVQVITGASFLALRSESPEDWKRALEKVQTQCCALTETTRAFLGFVRRRSAVGGGRFRLGAVVEETHRLARPLARRYGVEVVAELAEDADLGGEKRLAIQAIVNLVTNALRACSDRDAGRVAVRAGLLGPDRCRIEVADNGPGIPDGMRRRLFRPLASGQGAQGNGLGLFIVRQNVRRLGGTIRVRSSSNGTTFHVDLPRAG